MAVSTALLWIARPGADGTTIVLVLTAFIVATAMAEYIAVCTNSMMPSLVSRQRTGARLSGLSWAVGYLGGLVALFLMAGFVVSSPSTGKTPDGFAAGACNSTRPHAKATG